MVAVNYGLRLPTFPQLQCIRGRLDREILHAAALSKREELHGSIPFLLAEP